MPDENITQKVQLPREVAEAIEDVRKFYRDSEIIATVVTDDGRSAYGTRMMTLVKCIRRDDGFIDTLMSALVNGYTVEKTPEELEAEQKEKLRDYYRGLYVLASNEDSSPYLYEIEAEMKGIVETLDLLGVKITGVNAP
ncbi:hypothetical protein [Bacillus sp. FSL K6-3431]|uniref:hypothetical protein n=1 Tax=Bacillus sp. FSL K6-3431 TaxID=2921500 RepID=UPI0030F6A4AB